MKRAKEEEGEDEKLFHLAEKKVEAKKDAEEKKRKEGEAKRRRFDFGGPSGLGTMTLWLCWLGLSSVAIHSV